MDQETFKKVKKRDEEAFLYMMGLYKNTVYYTALTYFKDEEKALEAVQEVTFRAYRNCHKIKKVYAVKAWLVRITINYCLNEIKKNKRFKQDDDYIKNVPKTDGDHTTSFLLSDAIQSLKPKYQTVIMLKYQQDMKNREIAESLSLPEGTVKTYINRALKELKAYMKKGGFDEHESGQLFQ